MEQQKSHWEAVYERKRPEQVSWYQPHLTVSLRLLANAGLRPDSRVIDVGGGASTLADDLLDVAAHRELHFAFLDLGASVCRPTPRCPVCPLASLCGYNRKSSAL